MGELGVIRRYSYFSERRVRGIAADNNIDLDRHWRLGFKTPAWGLLPQAEVMQERSATQRHEVALRVERAIGQLAVEDFVTPPPVAFAKGCSEVTFAAYTRSSFTRTEDERPGIVIHTRTKSTSGRDIEVCLFGSIDNCAGWLAGSEPEAPAWSASSSPFIDDFVASFGKETALVYDDESIGVEVLRVFNNEGMIGAHVFNRLTSAEWFAEVHHDVELDRDQWNLPEPVDRIVIGAPLWVRSTSG